MLSNLEGGDHNEETDRLFAYHQATKHTYQSVRANARFLDWQNQPNPFRTYEGAPLVTLTSEPGFPESYTFATMAHLAENPAGGARNQLATDSRVKLDANLLSRLLWHSMAISAWKKVPGSGARYSLRVNPSSGNLHPTETYLAVCGFAGFESGLYHYRADRHALELRNRGNWTRHLADALEFPPASDSDAHADARPGLIVGLTSIFWREAWKYGNRAYRYCCHDLGHAMMSLLLAGRALGMPGGVVTHFSDLRLARVLGLAESDEAPMAFVIFRPEHASSQIDDMYDNQFMGAPNELSREEVPYYLLLGMHRSTILPDSPGAPAHSPQQQSPSAMSGFADDESAEIAPLRDAPFASTVRHRRSALDFDPVSSPLENDEFLQLLDFATRDWHADWRGNFGGDIAAAQKGLDFVTLYFYVHRVRDCEPGVYRWDRSRSTLEVLHRANVQRIAAFLSLEQALAGNACFAVSMIADLAKAARIFGNRGYRLIHFEAGAIGQRLYLGAEALGFRATGIGAFYDDDVHRYLGLLEEGESSVHSTLRDAERTALVMLNSPASRGTARDKPESAAIAASILESRVDSRSDMDKHREGDTTNLRPADPRFLPQQVIYHFAVGHAVPDPRMAG